MTLEETRTQDPADMYGAIIGFAQQVKEAVAIGESSVAKINTRTVDAIVLTGLGGSAIGGDLLRSYLAAELAVPMVVNRAYTLPRFVGPRTLVIVSSYSGNTEETIAAHREAIKRKAKILCISSNGTTARMARKSRHPLVTIPGGMQPRAALGYSFFPLLILLGRLGFVKQRKRDIGETITLLERKAQEYGDPDNSLNRALQLAGQMERRINVIYSSTERFDAVATRWRGQIAENAKSLAWGHVVPEMNHNELVGWKALGEAMREMNVLFLRDAEDHKRIQMRMEITKGIIGDHAPRISEVWSEGRSLLARIFSLVHLGDWVSFYLAMLHREDPTPVAVIDHLKNELAKS